MAYDLVIRNGTVIDGTGAPGFRADVGIVGDRIATVGVIDEPGATEIDADGHVVTPGFVDGHTHLDAQICWDPLGTPVSSHGVTTVVMGNCGFTLAPCREPEAYLALRSLERAEDMSAEVLATGVQWRWETYREYLDAVEALPKGINYAGYVGHSALRTYVMGERAFSEPATDDDITAMRGELDDALRAGAVGFTTSRSPNHETSDDRPVASRLADWSEIERLVGVLGELGTGVFELANEQHENVADRDDYYRRLRDLAVGTGRPVTFIVAATRANPDRASSMLDNLDATAAAGGTMVGQTHVREFQAVLSFKTRMPFDRLPEWNELRSLPLDAQRAAFQDPEVRARLVDAAGRGGYARAIGAEVRAPEYAWIRVFDTPIPPYRTVTEVAAERRVDPALAMVDLALEHDFDQFFLQAFGNEVEDEVLTMLRHPHTIVATSDTGAHVSQIMDSSIPTHLLAYWVREREAITLEAAIRKMTSEPARLWGFTDRGVVREGAAADVNVIDTATVGPLMPEIAYDFPTGARRLRQGARGIAATVVGGTVLMRDGEHTGELPGRLLRGSPVTA
jgi:N-acyl-D-aspartate/D-glutamate deacylase